MLLNTRSEFCQHLDVKLQVLGSFQGLAFIHLPKEQQNRVYNLNHKVLWQREQQASCLFSVVSLTKITGLQNL